MKWSRDTLINWKSPLLLLTAYDIEVGRTHWVLCVANILALFNTTRCLSFGCCWNGHQLNSFLWIIGCFFPSLHGNSNNNKSCMYFSWQMIFVQFMMGLLKDFSLRDYLYVLWDKTIRSIWSLLIEFYFGYNSLLYPYKKKKNLHKERVQTANHAHYQSWFSCWRRGLRKTLFFSLLIEIHIEQYFMENSCCVSFFTLCLHDIYWLYWEQINAVHNLTESWLLHVLCSPIATLVYTA